MGQAVVDFDNDGLLDWFVTAIFKQDDGVAFSGATVGIACTGEPATV
ncbi:MAG: hypothetical protein U5K56_00450 [Halioglobus sp.]|nr:hypothetical protein [Halioglobus sp.]